MALHPVADACAEPHVAQLKLLAALNEILRVVALRTRSGSKHPVRASSKKCPKNAVAEAVAGREAVAEPWQAVAVAQQALTP